MALDRFGMRNWNLGRTGATAYFKRWSSSESKFTWARCSEIPDLPCIRHAAFVSSPCIQISQSTCLVSKSSVISYDMAWDCRGFVALEVPQYGAKLLFSNSLKFAGFFTAAATHKQYGSFTASSCLLILPIVLVTAATNFLELINMTGSASSTHSVHTGKESSSMERENKSVTSSRLWAPSIYMYETRALQPYICHVFRSFFKPSCL